MKILMLQPSPNIKGPLPKIATLLENGIRQAGCQVSTSTWGAHKDQETYINKVTGRIRDIGTIRRLLNSEHVDLFFITTAHDWKGITRDIALLCATIHRRPKTILLFHGSNSNLLLSPGNWLFKSASRLLLKLCDAVCLLSTEEQAEWQKFYPQRQYFVVVNPFVPSNDGPGVYDRHYLNLPEGLPVLLFVGRLMAQKGIFEILDALEVVIQKIPCHLLIVGDGPQIVHVKESISNHGLMNYVTMTGYLNSTDLTGVYQLADIFVLPTWAEGFPTVIAEAMGAGLPIVTTQIRGAADLLQEGVNVRFVPVHNSPALAEVLEQLLSDPQQRLNISRANLAKVKEFAPEVVVQRYIQIFQELVGQNNGTPVQSKVRSVS